MPDALRLFATDLDDSSADLIIAALIINSRLRGPGLRDLLGALSRSVREELDMRRKVSAERRSTRRSVQIVVLVSVGMALGLAFIDRAFLAPYSSPFGQVVLALIASLYGLGIWWLRRLASFESPQRMLGGRRGGSGHRGGGRPGGRQDIMTEALVIGGLTGLALFLAVFALIPRRVGLAGRIAAFDASQVAPLHRPRLRGAGQRERAHPQARQRARAGSSPGLAGSSRRCGPTCG